MLKRLLICLAILAGLTAPVHAAGTISLSFSQQFDSLGKPLNGGLLYLYAAGTTTPQSAYQDSDLTLPLPNPITLDSAGRVPQFFLADGSIKVRLTNAAGVVQVAADGILVIGASSGGGGGSPVDPTTILTTGDVKSRYGTGNLTGFVRLNGRTIGSSTSGASERANADCQSLFEYLWQADANLIVSTGRGVSANADWVANKTIALPDFRSRALAGLGDMGNSDNALFSGVTFTSGASTTLGSLLGAARRTLLATQIPAHTHPNTLTDPGHTHALVGSAPDLGGSNMRGGGGPNNPFVGVQSAVTGVTINNEANTGGGNPFDSVSPFGLVTLYVKL